ncbi:hypothetical protein MMMDOFMJ_1272 [Methylobacterium gnaphalii]|nr:hypothetical protein MMMDOFMJ_1272 [Methylobacterium gnaphalii]
MKAQGEPLPSSPIGLAGPTATEPGPRRKPSSAGRSGARIRSNAGVVAMHAVGQVRDLCNPDAAGRAEGWLVGVTDDARIRRRDRSSFRREWIRGNGISGTCRPSVTGRHRSLGPSECFCPCKLVSNRRWPAKRLAFDRHAADGWERWRRRIRVQWDRSGSLPSASWAWWRSRSPPPPEIFEVWPLVVSPSLGPRPLVGSGRSGRWWLLPGPPW